METIGLRQLSRKLRSESDISAGQAADSMSTSYQMKKSCNLNSLELEEITVLNGPECSIVGSFGRLTIGCCRSIRLHG
jgi:hypothetical protein